MESEQPSNSKQEAVSFPEKLKIGIQLAQFIVVGVIGTCVALYGERIKEDNAAAARRSQEQNDKVLQVLRETETKTTQAKVVQEILNFLFDTKDEAKPKAAVLIIRRFIDAEFALQIAELVSTPGTKAAADQIIQAEAAKPVPSILIATTPPGGRKQGWVYLGRFEGDWKTKYFEFPSDKTPDDLVRDKTVIWVKPQIGAANLRKEPMRAQDPDSSKNVVGVVRHADRLQIDQVEPRLGTSNMWAHVSVVPQESVTTK